MPIQDGISKLERRFGLAVNVKPRIYLLYCNFIALNTFSDFDVSFGSSSSCIFALFDSKIIYGHKHLFMHLEE